MQLGQALDRIAEIHGHLDRAEVYRGLGPTPLAVSAGLAVAASLLQPVLIGGATGHAFVVYWVTVAVATTAVCGGAIAFNYLFREDAAARRRTLRLVGQAVPSIAAGAAVTVGLGAGGAPPLALLPGLWAIVYSLGLFAVRPYLPRAIGYVALFYLLGGAWLLLAGPIALHPWSMGVLFGLGQAGLALVVHGNVSRERRD